MISTKDFYPAPEPSIEPPLSIENLESALSKDGSDSIVEFALANLYLANSQSAKSIPLYQSLLSKDSEQAKVRCNLAVAYRDIGNYQESINQLKQSLLKDASLELAYYHLAKAQINSELPDEACLSLQKLLRLNPKNSQGLILLGQIEENRNDTEVAKLRYQEALKSDPESEEAKICLGGLLGIEALNEQSLDSIEHSFEKLDEIFRDFPTAFYQHQRLVRVLHETVSEFNKQDKLQKSLQTFKEGVRDEPKSSLPFYKLFCEFFFSLNLIPEAFEKEVELENSIKHWLNDLEEQGEHPYPHFRIGIIYCYQGKIEEAFDKMIYCRDTLPEKKRYSLRIDEILDFIHRIRRIASDAKHAASLENDDEWIKYGFDDAFQRDAWRKASIPAPSAKRWREAGFSAEGARSWDKLNIEVEKATTWKAAGFTDATKASIWLNAGFSPDEAGRWEEHFSEDPNLAVQCRVVGLEDPAEAKDWLRVFMFPSEAVQWMKAGFKPAEAVIWQGEGVNDPFYAKELQAKKDSPQNKKDSQGE